MFFNVRDLQITEIVRGSPNSATFVYIYMATLLTILVRELPGPVTLPQYVRIQFFNIYIDRGIALKISLGLLAINLDRKFSLRILRLRLGIQKIGTGSAATTRTLLSLFKKE
jgi:hypothetical protein